VALAELDPIDGPHRAAYRSAKAILAVQGTGHKRIAAEAAAKVDNNRTHVRAWR